ncbi:MAG: hypothetical protein H6Q92_1387, partial [Nitrospirae bacterium]|nr:hypothetical protein [Nitrospirota bacterium]
MDFNRGLEIQSSPATIMIDIRGESGFIKFLFMTIAFIIMSHICLSPIAYSAPLAMTEKFVYDLTWTGIKAGTASLELKNDGDKVKILSTAQSASWVSVFYTVDDRVESTLLKDSAESFFQPSQYRIKIREGRHRRDKEIIFDAHNSRAIYIDRLKPERKDFQVTPQVLDPLSGFYYLRLLKLSVGQPVYITI